MNRKTKSVFRLLNDPSFQGVKRLFLLSFEDNDDTTGHTGYFFS